MRFLWGVSGPAFLVLYVVLLLLAYATGSLLGWVLDRRVARRDGDGALPDPTVEELALVAGGPVRVVQTAIARLVDTDVLRVGRDRRLAHTGLPPEGPLDRAVVDAVAAHRLATAAKVIKSVRRHTVVDDIVATARRRGLVHDPAALRTLRVIAVVVAVAVFVFGVLRLVGSAAGAPTNFLKFLLLACVAVVVPGAWRSTAAPRRTRRGKTTLDSARTGSVRAGGRTIKAAPVALGVAGLVAVGGMAAYPDDEVSGLLASPSGSGGVFGGGGGDGGGGGGGGCGGGGGGCGGGGGG